MDFKVVEIFDSIEGEGKRAGALASFVRLAGCNLRCSYCDTTYSFGDEYSVMSIDDILARLNERRLYNVTLTGGEPLLAPGVEVLVNRLISDGFEVNIETNGSVDISPVLSCFKDLNMCDMRRLFFTMDYKLPSSGVNHAMFADNFSRLSEWDVIKFVVGGHDDIRCMIKFLEDLKDNFGGAIVPQVYIGAVHRGYELQDLVEVMLNTPILKDARLQLQFHKIIWDAEERGV